MKNKLFLRLGSIIIAMVFGYLNGQAQSREVTPYYPNLISCIDPAAGTAVDLRFKLNTNESARWTASGSLPVPLVLPGAAVTATELVISGALSAGVSSPGDYPFSVTATITGQGSWTRNYVLKVKTSCAASCPATRDYVLLLDQSGSMFGSAGGGASKWDVLKDAVADFLPNLVSNAGLGADDHLWVAFFGRGDADQLDVVGNWTFDQTWITRRADIDQRLFQYSPGVNRGPEGATPLGGGLQKAFLDFLGGTTPPFPAPDKMRNVIIFTDGMQNQNPVTGDPNDLASPHDHLFNLAGKYPPDGVLGTPGVNIPLTTWGSKFKIFTIGVGASPGFRDQLRKIAEPADLYAQTDVVTDLELRRFFNIVIPNSLKECSPRILDYRSRTIAAPAVQHEQFRVNRFVNHLSIKLNSSAQIDKESVSFKLLKDGQEMDLPYVLESKSLAYNIEFPLRVGQEFIDETGVWELVYTARKGEKYDVFAMVEDKSLSAQLNVGNAEVYYPGTDIPVALTLKYEGKAIADAQVQGLLLRPGEDLGDLAAKTVKNISGTPLEAGQDQGQQKIDLLMKDPAFYQKLLKEGSIVNFSNNGNGEYSHMFKAGEVTGTYQAILFFKGASAGSGEYQGWESKCVLVDFGKAQDIELNPVLSCKTTGKSDGVAQKSCTLTFMPTNRYGNRLGPAQGNRIKLQSSQAILGPLKDNLDGSYQTELSYSGSSPDISVFVVDGKKPVYDGKLSNIQGGRWGISAHAGVTAPLKGLDSLYNNGYYGAVDLTFRLNAQHWIELLGGFYAFKPNYNLLGATLSYKVAGNVRPNVIATFSAGAGAFKAEQQDPTPGISGRAGLSWKPNPHVMLGLDAGLYYLTQPKSYFATAGVAAHYFF